VHVAQFGYYLFLKKKLYWVNKYTIIAGDPEEPTTLISTLLLQTHAWRLYSLALTRFLWTSTKNVWNANNAMFSQKSCVFGPWIKWNSGTATVPSSPNCHFLLTVYVAFEPLSPQNKSTVLYITSLAQNTELSQWNQHKILLLVPKYFITPRTKHV